MKAYFLVSPYLSDIQKGIQVAHTVANMAVTAGPCREQLEEWVTYHRTIIVLSYGTNKNIFLYLLLRKLENNLDNTRFYSLFEEPELNYLMTIGFILSKDDIRKIGNFRYDRHFKVSKELKKTKAFEEEEDHVSKKEWLRLLETTDPDTNISWDDFLRILSTMRTA